MSFLHHEDPEYQAGGRDINSRRLFHPDRACCEKGRTERLSRSFAKAAPRRSCVRIDRLQRVRCRVSLMGVLRSPLAATCPSIASRFFVRGRIMSSFTVISTDKL